jgi:seryl-tRNA synthetase
MINPDIIRKNPEILKENIRRREINFDVERIIELDNKRREFQVKIDNLRSDLNKITDKIAEVVRSGEKRRRFETASKTNKRRNKIS